MLKPVVDAIRIRRSGPGRPRTRPSRVIADKAYSSRANRGYLRRRGIAATIPEKDDQAANRRKKGSHGGRPPAFDPETYKQQRGLQWCRSIPDLTSSWPSWCPCGDASVVSGPTPSTFEWRPVRADVT